MTRNLEEPTAQEIAIKTIITHTVTYFIAGVLAFAVFDYQHLYAETNLKYLMRPTTDSLVLAGPLFQPIRGMMFGMVFFILRRSFFSQSKGWLLMWVVLVCLGILGTFGPAPSSLEGTIYTILPLRLHLIGLPEVLLQSFLLSFIVFYWVKTPKKWLTWSMSSVFVLVLLLSLMGLLSGHRR